MSVQDIITFEGITCTLTIEKIKNHIIRVKITGTDAGEFGEAPLLELEKYFINDPVKLFIDAGAVNGASLEVSGLWANWLYKHTSQFSEIHMLTGSRFIQLTADFVKHYAALGETMKIYTDNSPFIIAFNEALSGNSE